MGPLYSNPLLRMHLKFLLPTLVTLILQCFIGEVLSKYSNSALNKYHKTPKPKGKKGGECLFTKDCSKVEKCKNMGDAHCICNHKRCIIVGGGFDPWGITLRPKQCKTYKDCPCRKNQARCFCHNGQCSKEKWECHTDNNTECNKMDKCKGKECKCRNDNICHWECDKVADCKFCLKIQKEGRYRCRCRKGQCDILPKKKK